MVTRQQAAQIEAHITKVLEDRSTPTEPTDYFNERHLQPIRGVLRSCIIVDPPDGRIPGTPWFRQWQIDARANILHAMDGPEQRPASERCIGNPASQPPNLFNPGTNLHQIVQTESALVFVSEVMGFARIIRMNAEHAPAAITSWSGDSIGWWEGDTLVVETKYFTPSDPGRQATGIAFKISPNATVIERLTRVSEDELNYVFTVDDPTFYTRSWAGETHFMRTSDQLLEYACHEANYSLRFILEAARMNDAQTAAPSQIGSRK